MPAKLWQPSCTTSSWLPSPGHSVKLSSFTSFWWKSLEPMTKSGSTFTWHWDGVSIHYLHWHFIFTGAIYFLIIIHIRTTLHGPEAHCYVLHCKRIDCEQLRSSINQQLIAGRFSHEGLRHLHTNLFCTQVTKACYVIAHNPFACITLSTSNLFYII